MLSHKKGRPMRILESLDGRLGRNKSDYHKDLIKQINDCDGAVMILQKDRTLKIKYFGLHEEEMIHAMEWAKIKIMMEP